MELSRSWILVPPSPSRIFRRPETPRSSADVIRWWESRRLYYNVIVFVVGCISLVTYFAIVGLEPRPPMEETEIPGLFICMGAFFILIVANICYSGGWILELVAHLAFRRWTRLLGPIVFAAGLAFSIGVVWMPTISMGLRWLHRLT